MTQRGPRRRPRHRLPPRPRADRRRAPPSVGASCAGDAEAVRGERTGDAVRDGGTHRSLPRQRPGKLGVQGGRSVPLARPQCLTLRGLAYAPCLRTLVSVQGGATAVGNAPSGGCVPSELPGKALVGSPEHHGSGLGSNAVEGTDQQRFLLADRLPCLAAGSQRRRAGLAEGVPLACSTEYSRHGGPR